MESSGRKRFTAVATAAIASPARAAARLRTDRFGTASDLEQFKGGQTAKRLHTICARAAAANRASATGQPAPPTFLVGGPICTAAAPFCQVEKARTRLLRCDEAERVARSGLNPQLRLRGAHRCRPRTTWADHGASLFSPEQWRRYGRRHPNSDRGCSPLNLGRAIAAKRKVWRAQHSALGVVWRQRPSLLQRNHRDGAATVGEGAPWPTYSVPWDCWPLRQWPRHPTNQA